MVVLIFSLFVRLSDISWSVHILDSFTHVATNGLHLDQLKIIAVSMMAQRQVSFSLEALLTSLMVLLLNFWGHSVLFFQNGGKNPHLNQQCARVPLPPYPFQHLSLFIFSFLWLPSWQKTIPSQFWFEFLWWLVIHTSVDPLHVFFENVYSETIPIFTARYFFCFVFAIELCAFLMYFKYKSLTKCIL